MQEYEINVTEIEDLQTYQNKDALDKIFTRAERTVLGGEKVILVRGYPDGRREKFDELTTEEDLAAYKRNVYKYLV